MNELQTSHAYARWFDKLINDYIDREKIEWQPRENYLQWNARFVTLTFDKRKISRRQSALNASSDTIDKSVFSSNSHNNDGLTAEAFNVDRFYKKVCRELLGSNYARKRDQQPMMIAAADANGSKYGRPQEISNLHFHTLWVFRNKQINSFDSMIDVINNSPRTNEYDFDQIDNRQIDHFREMTDGTSYLSSYVAKFLGVNCADNFVDRDVLIYPRDENGQRLAANSTSKGYTR